MISNNNIEIRKSFLLFTDSMKTALTRLKTMQERGELLTKIVKYVTKEQSECYSDIVETCFAFIENSLILSEEKYQRKKLKNLQYQNALKEKKRRLEEEIERLSQSEPEPEPASEPEPEPASEPEPEPAEPSQNDPKKIPNLNYNSKEMVLSMLQKNNITLKPLSFTNFYRYNSVRGWQFDPVTAVGFWIEKHPNCLIVKENAKVINNKKEIKIETVEKGVQFYNSLKIKFQNNKTLLSYFSKMKVIKYEPEGVDVCFAGKAIAETFKENYSEVMKTNYNLNFKYCYFDKDRNNIFYI